MTEFFAGLFVGLVYWEIGFILLAILVSGISLKNESGLFFTIPLVAVGIYFFNIELTWLNAGIYLFGAVVWLVFKFRMHVKYVMNTYTPGEHGKGKVKDAIFRDINADIIFFWFIAWPFSLTAYFFTRFLSDLISTIWNAFSTAAKAFYKKVRYFLSNIVDNMLAKAGFKD